MKISMVVVVMVSALSASAFAGQWDQRVIRAQGKAEISKSQMFQELSAADIIVMGEKHNVAAVQNAEGEIIRNVTTLLNKHHDFTTAWEFLEIGQQELIAQSFQKFMSGEITALDFLTITQGDTFNNTYTAILEATKEFGGQFIGVNLSRKEKAPVVKYGIGAADPALVPPGFAFGSDGYRERFSEVMGGGHTNPEQVANYYAAQCLTDDVMAYHLLKESAHALRFIVMGSFHSDYFDGTVGRIKIRAPEQKTAVVRIVDASDYEEKDLMSVIHDEKYGDVADFVLYVNEPAAPGSLRTELKAKTKLQTLGLDF